MESLVDLLGDLCIEFNTDISRIYYIPPNQTWHESQILDTDDKLRAAIDEIKGLPRKVRNNCLYASSSENSPTSSPEKPKGELSRDVNNNGNVNALSSQSDGEAGGPLVNTNRSSTSKSSGSAQEEFREVILARDGKCCLVCGNCNDKSLEAAHVIDLFPKNKSLDVTLEQLQKIYHLSSKYDWKNGLLLCRNCHKQYDDFDMGIDGEGDVHMEEEDDVEEKKNIFKGIDSECRQNDYPSKLTLEWKFKQFEQKQRSRASSSIIKSFGSQQTKQTLKRKKPPQQKEKLRSSKRGKKNA